jgi:hypothetical protein
MHPLLKSLADNQELFDAVRLKIMQKFQIADVSDSESNEHIGQVVRARIDGRKLVEEAFREIATLKTIKEEETFNQAR